MNEELERQVRRRARDRCEYCRFPELLSELAHVIDHVIAKQHNGQTVLENLALACGRCNRHKGPNLSGIDPESGQLTRLFNPRTDDWGSHFRWSEALLLGTSPIGRATVQVLAINLPQRVNARRTLLRAGKLRF